jgi:hypothetical protein
MRKLLHNNYGSIIPVIWFILTLFAIGLLYTLLFIEIGVPTFDSWIPSSDSKTFIMMLIFIMPLIILLVGGFALLKTGLKRDWGVM